MLIASHLLLESTGQVPGNWPNNTKEQNTKKVEVGTCAFSCAFAVKASSQNGSVIAQDPLK